MGFTVDDSALRRALTRLAPTYERALMPVVSQGASEFAEIIKAGAPSDSGELAESVRSMGARTSNKAVSAEVRVEAEHAPFVEFGTEHMEAQPFVRPARDKAKRSLAGTLQRGGGRALARAAGSA